MSDSFTEVTSQGWFSRIGGSIKGILFGLITIPAALVLLWWNEGRAVATANSLKEGAAAVVRVDSTKVDPANDGKLVHLTGEARAAEETADPVFGIRVPALRLEREVEIYQWCEHKKSERKQKLGGGEETKTTYTYEKKWTDEPVDSSTFRDSAAHRNTGSLVAGNDRFPAAGVTVGGFGVPVGMVAAMPGAVTHPVTADDLKNIDPGIKAKVKTDAGRLYFGEDPAAPHIGDQRVAFAVVKPGTFSLMAKQVGNTLEPYPTKAGRSLSFVEAGAVSPEAMFQNAATTNRVITWLVRLGGFLLMGIGFTAITRPLAVLGSVIPMLGNIVGMGGALMSFVLAGVISFVVIAVAWLAARPMLGISLLVLAAVGVFFLWRLAAAGKAKAGSSA